MKMCSLPETTLSSKGLTNILLQLGSPFHLSTSSRKLGSPHVTRHLRFLDHMDSPAFAHKFRSTKLLLPEPDQGGSFLLQLGHLRDRSAMELNLVWTLALTLLLAALISISFLLPVFNRTNKSVTANAIVKREGPFSVAEVAKHNKDTDLWIILKNKVYDVTSFVEEHPGGEAIMNNAGADSTEGFYGPQHGTKVFEMLDDFYIGELAQ